MRAFYSRNDLTSPSTISFTILQRKARRRSQQKMAAAAVDLLHVSSFATASELGRQFDPFAISAIPMPDPWRTHSNTARSFPLCARLDDFNIEPAISNRSDRRYQTSCFLKACVIKEPNNFYNIIFRIESIAFGECLPERLFHEALVRNHEWTVALSFHPYTYKWYHRNEPQLDRGFGHRLFMIPCKGTPPTKENLVKLGDWICLQLNRLSGTKAITVVDEFSYVWLNDNAVWADVLGYNAALFHLKRMTGEPKPDEDYFQQNKDVIFSFFHQGALSMQLATLLHAPYSEVAQRNNSSHSRFLYPAPSTLLHDNPRCEDDSDDNEAGTKANNDPDDKYNDTYGAKRCAFKSGDNDEDEASHKHETDQDGHDDEQCATKADENNEDESIYKHETEQDEHSCNCHQDSVVDLTCGDDNDEYSV